MQPEDVNYLINDTDIAIIALSGRFPGAKDVDTFWENLKAGAESISFFSEQELLSGINSNLLKNPNYVKASAVLEDIDLFDANFFDFSPREAEILDPQQRLFLECAWEAIEKAGYDPQTYKGLIGVYAGVGINSYLLNNLIYRRDVLESVGEYQVVLDSDKDFLPSRVAYKLNLKGPAVNIQTACSTSLVAVHVACQSLLNGECDMALAGGITLRVPHKNGYLYQEGMILSPDGHCRVFDAKAKGTVGGNGVGIVVLKRLADAVADGDCVHAVIKGSAINNDGSFKVGYTAPSIEGQASVIAEALALAQVDAESITYIEAHGTGTELGDPIEIAALNKVFQQRTEKKQFCAIGSLKSNMGHLDTAAGVAGLIKTVLALKHKLQPPSLHFTTPNPKIDFANSPFYVNTKLSQWNDDFPCRAGVSSFGIGGTNAHVILEEAPKQTPSGTSRPWQLLLISAKTSSALDKATANLGEHLQQNRDLNLADVAYTASIGRQAFNHRRMLVTQGLKETANALINLDSKVFTNIEPLERDVVFMFPAQGAEYVNMALELYNTETVFQEQVDLCSQILEPELKLDIRQIVYPKQSQIREAQEQLQNKGIAEVAVFVIEYALAQLLLSWGISPQAMVGHGIGEYVAACLAEVFSLEAALSLVAARGGIIGKPVKQISFNPPKTPYISNLTGTWITTEQATNPNYYTQHSRQIIETQAIESLEAQILLEVGPGKTLSTTQAPQLVLKSVRHSQENQSDVEFLLTTLGHLWLAGVKIDWSGFYSQEQRYRVPLPTYPFERQRYWISPPESLNLSSDQSLVKKPDIADWFYVPSWKRLPLPVNQSDKLPTQVLLFIDECGLGEQLARQLIQQGIQVISVKVGASFSKQTEELYTLNPQQPKDYQALITELQSRNFIPEKFVHLWSVTDENVHQELDASLVDKASELGFYSLLFFVQACSQIFLGECEITVITNNIQDVIGSEKLCPEKATILGTLQTIPQEYPNFTCRAIDVIFDEKHQLIEQLVREIITKTTEKSIAYRRQNRWIQTFEKFPLPLPSYNKQLREKGVYLITGGLSYLGFNLAKHLAETVKARLILTGRSVVPAREEWSKWLASHDEQDSVSNQIRKVQELEELGAEVLVIKAQVADLQQMETAINHAEQQFGKINGVIHAAGAGAIWGQSINVIENITKEECQNQFTAKVYGTLVLAEILQNREIDFCMLTSSLSAILGGLGFVAYAAVNTFMDAFVHKYNQDSNYPWVSVDWDGWQSNQKMIINNQGFGDEISDLEITASEGVKAFEYILSEHKCSQLIVSTVELEPRINLWVKRGLIKKPNTDNLTQKTSENYIAPRNQTEEKIAKIFQVILGINQVSIHDSFLELGGDSLTGTQLLSQLKQTFAINLPISTVFESPTIAQLAEVIDSQQKSSENDIDKISDILKMVESLSEDEIGALTK